MTGRGARLAELARCLDVDELETALLTALRRDCPRVTALVRIGPDATPSRVSGPRGVRPWRPSEAGLPILAVPVTDDGERLGLMGYILDRPLTAVRRRAEARLSDLAALAAIPARNALRYAGALRLAYKDPLTGLDNRRALTDHLDREARRATRSSRPLAMMLLDLDRLKDINDAWGHDAGDLALRRLAGVLESAVRGGDVVARIGGDEFAVLFAETSAATARRIGERIQRDLARQEIRCGAAAALAALGVSFGVADLESAAGQPIRMMELADEALYAAKRARADGASAPAVGARRGPAAARSPADGRTH